MKNLVARIVTGSSALALAASATPAVPAAAADAEVNDELGAVDFSTPDRVRAYLEQKGVTQEDVQTFAAPLGLDVDGFYDMASQNFLAEQGRTQADYKIEYQHTVEDSMVFERTRRLSQQGKKVDGDCKFGEVVTDTEFGDHTVSEVVAVDFGSCERTIFEGAYDPDEQKTFGAAAQPTGPHWIPGGCGNMDVGNLPGLGSQWSKSPKEYQPTFGDPDGSQKIKYFKAAFVDPICIPITSTSLNVRWKNTPNSSDVTLMKGTTTHAFRFTELGESWPASMRTLWQGPLVDQAVTARNPVATARYLRTETKFPEHVVKAARVVARALTAGQNPAVRWVSEAAAVELAQAACGGNVADTTFYSEQKIVLHRNGAAASSGKMDVAGGCSNLVHQQIWHGSWKYAR